MRTATAIPDNERWLHEPHSAADIQRALEWASNNPASDAESDAVIGRLANGKG